MKLIICRKRLAMLMIVVLSAVLGVGAVCVGPHTSLQGLTPLEGLSDLLVNVIHRDSTGYVWIGTSEAVDRYDGNAVKSYPVPGQNERLKRVNALATASDGNLYVGNGEGLWMLAPNSPVLVRVADDQIQCAVKALLAVGNLLYIASDHGLYILNLADDSLKHFYPAGSALPASNRLNGIAAALDGSIWLTAAGAVHQFDAKQKQFHTYPYSGKASLTSIAMVGNVPYIASNGEGIMRLDSVGQKIVHYANCGNNIISAIIADGDSMLYVSTDGQGIRFISIPDGQTVCSISHSPQSQPRLRSNSVYSLLVDAEGLMWVGYYQDGLDYTLPHRDLFEVYSVPGLIDTQGMTVRAFYNDGPVKVIGTREGLYYVDEKRAVCRKFSVPEIQSNMIFAIEKYGDDYWIGTYGGGLYVLDGDGRSIRPIDIRGALNEEGSVFCLSKDAKGHIWVGTSQGVFHFNGNKLLDHFTHDNSRLPAGNVYNIFFDSNGTGWICAEEGLCIWDGSSLRDDVFRPDFPDKEKFRDIYESADHHLYFMPDRGEILRTNLALTEMSRFKPQGLHGSYNGAFVIEDNAGGLWYGTSNGLSRCEGEETFWRFNNADGLPNPSFTLCKPVKDENGDLWMGNNNGLILFRNSSLLALEPNLRPVRVTDVMSGHTSIPFEADRGFTLNNEKRNVSFSVSDFSYSSVADHAYECCLDGVDDNWHFLGNRSRASYYDLKPGKYAFRVRRIGEPASETSLSFKVSGPWWGWIVFVGLAILLAGVVFWMVKKKPWGHVVAQPDAPDSGLEEETASETSQSEESNPQESSEVKYRGSRYTPEQCQEMEERLNKLMAEEKLYVNPDLTMSMLATKLDLSSHALSYLFNQYMDTSFYEYINRLRVEMVKSMIDRGDAATYTIGAMGEMSGFRSKTSYLRSFKKVLGVTPKEYIKKQK